MRIAKAMKIARRSGLISVLLGSRYYMVHGKIERAICRKLYVIFEFGFVFGTQVGNLSKDRLSCGIFAV
jgi:hypothetical protein